MKTTAIFIITILFCVLGVFNARDVKASSNILIVFFSWSGNTRSIAHKIHELTGAEIFEIQLVKPYSSDYNTVLIEAKEDQKKQARPEIKNRIRNISRYDTILLGYPNWWASIPMPIASFLESYDLSGKTIIPFCSNGGGRLGQSISAIGKLCPNTKIENPISIYYGGGSSLDKDLKQWLKNNKVDLK